MTDKIEAQTKALADQVKKLLDPKLTNEEHLKELEKYNLMLNGADFSMISQAASKAKERTVADKVLAPHINKLAKAIKKLSNKR